MTCIREEEEEVSVTEVYVDVGRQTFLKSLLLLLKFLSTSHEA